MAEDRDGEGCCISLAREVESASFSPWISDSGRRTRFAVDEATPGDCEAVARELSTAW